MPKNVPDQSIPGYLHGDGSYRTFVEPAGTPVDPPAVLPNPENVFWVGHSLVNAPVMQDQMTWMVKRQGIAAQEHATADPPGAPLTYNWANPSAGGVNHTTELARGDHYDAIVIMENTGVLDYATLNPQFIEPDITDMARNFFNAAVAGSSDIDLYLYHVWYELGGLNGLTQSEMYEHTRPTWETVHDQMVADFPNNNVHIIPAALGIENMRAAIAAGDVPGITALSDLFVDQIHLETIGRYFIACICYACLYKRSPVGLTNYAATEFSVPYTGMPTAEQAAVFQQIAWDTVTSYSRSGVDPEPQISVATGASLQRAVHQVSSPAEPQHSYTGSILVGTNTSSPAYWEAPTLNDLRYQSAPDGQDLDGWIFDGAVGATTDSYGNIVALTSGSVYKWLILDAAQFYSGDYVLRWDHTASPGATVELSASNSGVATFTLEEDTPGRRVYRMALTDAFDRAQGFMQIRITGPVVADIDWHVILPDMEADWLAGETFNPHAVADFSGYDLIRFMDMASTNTTQVTNPADLSTDRHASWNWVRPVPYRHQIALAQKSGASAWLNISVYATPATVAAIAAEVRTQWLLGTPITVYLEWGNEIWNTASPFNLATDYVAAQGESNYPHLTNYWSRMGTELAQRSIDMKAAFVSAFGSDSSYIKLAVGGHREAGFFTDPPEYGEYSRWRNDENNIHTEMDVFTITGYVDGDLDVDSFAETNNVQNWTDLQFYTHLRDALDNTHIPTIETCRANFETLTGRTDAEFYMYEGGHHITYYGATSAIFDRYVAWLDSASAGDLYEYMLQRYIDIGVDGIAHFTRHTKYGSGRYFGMSDSLTVPRTPRAQAFEPLFTR